MAHLSPSTIFSPSVARQHLATSKDWNHIDAWLTAKYAPKAVPPIERTPETLKFLLQLSSLNETIDEQLDLYHLSTLSTTNILSFSQPNLLLDDLSQNLSREGETALEALASLSHLLNVQNGDTGEMARKIVELQREEFDVDQTAHRVEVLHKYLSTESQTLDTTISELKSPAYQVSPNLISQTQEYTRKAKTLGTSLPEMRERVKAAENLAGTDGGGKGTYPTIQEVVEEEKSFKELMREVKELEGEVKSFHGLPHDTDLARLEVEGLKVELRELVRKRDAMFEGLVERETPRKGR